MSGPQDTYSSFTNRTYLCLSYYILYVYLCLLFFIIKLTCVVLYQVQEVCIIYTSSNPYQQPGWKRPGCDIENLYYNTRVGKREKERGKLC